MHGGMKIATIKDWYQPFFDMRMFTFAYIHAHIHTHTYTHTHGPPPYLVAGSDPQPVPRAGCWVWRVLSGRLRQGCVCVGGGDGV